MKEIYSHCRGCVSSCGLIFEVEGNSIVSHRANRDSLVSEGYKCIKGDFSVKFLHGAEHRFIQSQKRTADGNLEPIDNQQLMDEVADKIRESLHKYGPRSVALYWGTAGYRKAFSVTIARQFMAAIGSPLNFSTMTIDQSAHWVVDGRMGVFATGRPFFEDVDVIAVTGSNPVISHSSPYQGAPLVNQRKKFRQFANRGGKLIVIDPRKTETARLADLHIQPKPGTDTEIFAGLIHLVLKNKWHDIAFCNRFITNLDQLRASVEPFTPERVAARAQIPEEQLYQAAKLISQAKKPSVGFGTGTSMSPNANTAAHMVEALNAICGGYTRAGDVLRNPGIFAKRSPVEMVIPPTRSWDQNPKLSTGHGTLYGEFPSSRLADEILNDSPDRIRTLFVLGANPMMAFGEPDRFRQALESLDSLVVIEPRATETTALANYVVAPPIQYEVADFNLTSSTIMPEPPVLQYTDAVVSPPEGTIEEWQFFNGLANRLGHTLEIAAAGFGASASGDVIRLDPSRQWTTEELIARTFESAGVSLDKTKAHPNGLAVESDEPIIVATAEADDGNRLDVCPQDVAEELSAVLLSTDNVAENYLLVNRRVIELMNSEFRDTDEIRRRYNGGRAPLYMHPDDMAEEGFQPGDIITITGEHGVISGCATKDPSLRRGVVSMPHCWGNATSESSEKRHTSWLVSMKPENIQKFDAMPQQSSLSVKLSRSGLTGD